MGKDRFNLLGGHRVTQGPQSSGYGTGVVRGVTDHIDQNIDDPRGLQLLRDSCRSQLLPLGPLRGSPPWFGAEVKVGVLELFSAQRVILDEKTKRIVHTQLQQILKLAVGLTCRRCLDEVDHGSAQCSMSGEADTTKQPNAVAIELGNAFERVVAPGMAIAGQISGGTKNAEDRRPRLGAQRFAKVIQKRHPLGPVEFFQSRKVLRVDRYSLLLKQLRLMLAYES